jgi:hypothetical protein
MFEKIESYERCDKRTVIVEFSIKFSPIKSKSGEFPAKKTDQNVDKNDTAQSRWFSKILLCVLIEMLIINICQNNCKLYPNTTQNGRHDPCSKFKKYIWCFWIY